jgi:hypothetical protein
MGSDRLKNDASSLVSCSSGREARPVRIRSGPVQPRRRSAAPTAESAQREERAEGQAGRGRGGEGAACATYVV